MTRFLNSGIAIACRGEASGEPFSMSCKDQKKKICSRSGKGKIMLPFRIVPLQSVDDHPQVCFVAKEVGVRSVDKNGPDIMLFYIIGICFLDAEQIIVRDILLIRAVAFPDILLQLLNRRMQIN